MTPQDYLMDLYDKFVDDVDIIINARGKLDQTAAAIARGHMETGMMCLHFSLRNDPRDTDHDIEVPMDFGAAINQLKLGRRVTRRSWGGNGMYLEMQVPDEGSKMTQPYIYMRTDTGCFVPWVASQMDMLADDWVISTPLPSLPETEGD